LDSNERWTARTGFAAGWQDAVLDHRHNEVGMARAINIANFSRQGHLNTIYLAYYLAAYNTVERGYIPTTINKWSAAGPVPGTPERFELPHGH
jgi:hypothetical protein